ncbi:hypothetical protein [Chitiniphilus eburneus]|uniref:Uncharacterized protein n=1 Tax=Chitiniphilus eburneus TaxID=2571148 RepID=A0A4U0Q582_9NEIS|nr:hypothetical protein [Chitiniphilus eburneus]TJZ76317.1 hypothetical protein FAZ21_05960 [Chitiniphilus eburneus]
MTTGCLRLIRSLALVLPAMLSSVAALASNPPPNPYLAAEKYAVTHFDSAQTDAFPYAVPQGTSYVSALAGPQVLAGPINLMTLATTSPDYMWGVSTTGVSYIRVASNQFTPVARLLLPGVTQTAINTVLGLLTQPLTTLAQAQQIVSQLGLSGGGISSAYSVVDNQNVLYVNYGKTIYAFALNVPALPVLGIHIERSLDTTTFLQSGESVAGLVMTYDGKLVILGTRSVSIVNRSFTGPIHTATFNSDEYISNSAAVDSNNGIYVISDKLMRKVVWTGSALSTNPADGAWVSPYDTGDTFPTVFGSGSGATPTLMGFGDDPDKLVVITDGLQRMKLVAFWRDQIPAGFSSRVAGQIQVNCNLPPQYQIQTDQSVAVDGYGAFVVNNVSALDGSTGSGNAFVDALVRGPLLPPPAGVERFQWDTTTHGWSSTWARSDISSNTMVPGISSASGIVFANGYYTDGRGWTVVGMDWNTGQTLHQTVFGNNILGNGFYALTQFLPDGDLLFNSVIGPVRVQEPGGVVYPF